MITNIHTNCVGTTSFDAKFPKMLKSQDFIVYPMDESGTSIKIQSDTRMGDLDLKTGDVVMSAPHAGGASFANLQIDIIRKKALRYTIPMEDLQTLKEWIKSTGGVLVGDSGLKVENIGAIAL